MWRRALAIGFVCEGVAFAFLHFGQWEFLGPIDVIGKVGVMLHLPGFWVARQIGGLGNFAWLIILGVPLIMWLVLGWCLCFGLSCSRASAR
jgi:hypothetical protein